MIETNVIIGLIFSVVICFLVPIISLIYFTIKYKKIPKSFIIGMLVFFISQVVIRIPILNYVLPNSMWFIKMSTNPYLYGIFLGLTAGIFEEVGRFIAFKYILKKNDKWIDGVSYGLGHGGIEAILITGFSCLNLLIGCIMINNGTLINQSSNTALNTLYNQCIGLTVGGGFISGFERISAMAIHIGLSMIILYGVRNRKIVYLFISILIHTLVNAPIVIFPYAFNMGVLGLEVYFFIWAVILVTFTIYSKKLYEKDALFKAN